MKKKPRKLLSILLSKLKNRMENFFAFAYKMKKISLPFKNCSVKGKKLRNIISDSVKLRKLFSSFLLLRKETMGRENIAENKYENCL